MITKLLLLSLFGIAMAHLEGVVVVYLRKVLGILDSDSNKESVGKFPERYLKIEMTREAATIVMLIVIAWLVGGTWIEKGIFFLWTFAFWDLFYYVSLYILIKWPPKFTTIDVLFLIPKPWIAPVWFPVGVSTLTILIIAILFILNLLPPSPLKGIGVNLRRNFDEEVVLTFTLLLKEGWPQHNDNQRIANPACGRGG